MKVFSIPTGRAFFWQWDLNQKLIVEDTSCSQVHFSNAEIAEALVLNVIEKDNRRFVNIPNILLQSPIVFQAFTYISDGDNRHTRYSTTFNVVARPKPADYLYTETEVVTVKSLVETALEEAKESGDLKGEKGEKGDKGDPGYTPVRGTDYYTEADKQEMVNAVLAALPAAEGVSY